MIKKTAFIIAFLLLPHPVSALTIYSPDILTQGSTLEILVPAENIDQIKGEFNGEQVLFYPTTKIPNPDEAISRAEFLEMMFSNHDFGEIDISGTKDFPDIDNMSPYYKYIQEAAALGIVSGYEDGLFRPYTPITRGQITKILTNAFPPTSDDDQETSEIDVLGTSDVINFPDVPSDHRFYNYIQTAITKGWFKGYPDGLMRPDRDINFAEAEIVIKRAAAPATFTPQKEKPYFHAYTAIHRTTQPGTKQLTVTAKYQNHQESGIKDINIITRQVPTIRFSLPEEKTDLFADDAQTKTWTAIDNARTNPSNKLYFTEPFIIPTKGEITLGFGDKLYINGAYSGSHFGIDYANQQGTEIKAANNGLVTLSEYTPAYGNTVVIDHGQNIYTMYLHMSELKAKKDQLVEQGETIGLMGSTGIASGPHLHYTMFIGNIIVDSDEWL